MKKSVLVPLLGGAIVAMSTIVSAVLMDNTPPQPVVESPAVFVGVNRPSPRITSETGIIYSSSAVTSSSGTTAYITISVAPVSRTPRFWLICDDEDHCTARGSSMEQAREMLERIAERGVRVDITIDQNCHPQRETIQPHAAEVALAIP